jgi:(S)-2-hydroxyglutarate dehydrogenase
MKKSNILILGGGIVGLGTAYNLCRQYPDKSITIIEKEPHLAAHQTGRNSGVLHTGIYYKPGSLKALNCRKGKRLMEAFCQQEGIPFDLVGKVIVATSEDELPAMQMLYERGQANGVNCTLISKERLLELEPHVNGIAAIHVPEAGITDYKLVVNRFAEIVQAQGGNIVLNAQVTDIVERGDVVTAVTTQGDYTANYLINCTGLHSDRLTRMTAGTAPAQIVPFRGEYFELKPEAHHLCNGLIYPVPNPKFPFLGVHFTRMIHGGVDCGPNAVLAFAREGYNKLDINARDLWETLTYSGFRKLAGQYWVTGMGEMWRSANKAAFVKALQKLVPAIRKEHLTPAPAGIRAQALRPDGSMLDDFEFQESKRIVNVVNAPSPAATSSISIGETVMERLAAHFV